MGQSNKMIEEAVINLENQRLVTLAQAENFIEDYHNDLQFLNDVKNFTQSPNLTLFLKYYIAHKYPNKENMMRLKPIASKMNCVLQNNHKDEGKIQKNQIDENKQRNCMSKDTKNAQKVKIEKQVLELISQQIKQKVLKQYQQMENTISETLKELCNMLINQRIYDMRPMIISKLHGTLGLTDFVLIQYDYLAQTIQKYQGNTHLYRIYTEDDSQFNKIKLLLFENTNQNQSLARIIRKESLVTPTLNKQQQKNKERIQIRFTQGNKDIIMEFSQNQKPIIGELISRNLFEDSFGSIIQIIVRSLGKIFFQENYLQSEVEKFNQLYTLILKMLEFYLRIHEKFIHTQFSEMLHIKEAERIESIDILLQKFLKKQSIVIDNDKKQLLSDITKYTKRIDKQLLNIQNYLGRISSNYCFFMDFDRYGELKFCYGDSQHNITLKLKDCWNKNRLKIVDIMAQYHSVVSYFRQAIKGNFKEGVQNQQYDEVKCTTFINENSVLNRMYIDFLAAPRKIKMNKSESQWVMFESEEEIEEENHLATKEQQKLIKDLEEENPHIKSSGWLNLFVKQSKTNFTGVSLKSLKKTFSERYEYVNGEKIEQAKSPFFDVLNLQENRIMALIQSILQEVQLFSMIIDNPKIKKNYTSFITGIKNGYCFYNNSYHNFLHGINVMHMCHIFSVQQNSQELLSDIELLSLLISGLCHDVGHPGTTNEFEVETFSQHTITYNDISPLQNHSSFKCLQVLRHNNFLENQDSLIQMRFKNNLVHNILSTDIKQYDKVLKQFEKYRKMDKEKQINNNDSLTAMIILCSDNCSYVKPSESSNLWSAKLYEEFKKLHEKQKKMSQKKIKVETTSFMKEIKNINQWIKEEKKFVQLIILPLYKQLADFYGNDSSVTQLLLNIKSGIGQGDRVKNKLIQITEEI